MEKKNKEHEASAAKMNEKFKKLEEKLDYIEKNVKFDKSKLNL